MPQALPSNLPPGTIHPPIPQQPDAMGRGLNLRQTLEPWNPLSDKNLAFFYQFDTGPEQSTLEIIPDACFDLVFRLGDNPGAFIQGPVMFQTSRLLKPNSTYFIFKPYSLTSARRPKIPFHELIDHTVPFEEQFDDLSIVEKLCQSSDFNERVRLMIAYAREHLLDPDYKPGLVERLESATCGSRGTLRIEQLTDRFGRTGRHCRAKFKEVHGISLKNYSDIMRFQNTVRMFAQASASMASDIVHENHFYDQAHLIHDFRKYTRMTPCEFRKTYFQA